MKKIIVEQFEIGERIDKFLSAKFPTYSREYFLDLIKKEKVLLNKKSVKPSYLLKDKDIIEFDFIEQEKTGEPQPEKIDLNIIYEDDNVIVLNKQSGIVVHPACGNTGGTLVNALIEYFPKIKEAVYDENNLVSLQRPGLVHRLDKDTSGAIIIAKNKRAMHSLSRQIQNRNAQKTYLAVCLGWPKEDSGHLESHLGRHPKNRKKIANIGEGKGKEAISDYKVKKYFDTAAGKFSLIEFDIKTGRTHQIRVQASDMGNPVLGDNFYGNTISETLSHKLKIKRQLLHANQLKITLPGDNNKTTFVAPLPEDIRAILDKLTPVQIV